VIKLQNFTFIDKKSDNQGNSNNAPAQQAPQQQYQAPQQQSIPQIDMDADHIPFN